jgi:RNA polymerase sigma-70 factor (ECF subfamily)
VERERADRGDGPDAVLVLEQIRSLPEAYRETLLMRLVEGMTGPEIARQTGLKPESVRVNLCRGMKMLRELLGGLEVR